LLCGDPLSRSDTNELSLDLEIEEGRAYQRQLQLFSRCSQEKSIELVLAGEVISQLQSTADFLDIGAGTGSLTAIISTFFNDSTVIEPNKKQAEHFRRRYPRFHVYEEKWETVDLGSKLFDLIFCSHVLYYIAVQQWLDVIGKMYAHLKDKGRIAIVLQSPAGDVARFFREFSGCDVPVIELWRDLTGIYGHQALEVRYFVNEIFAETLEDMISIGLFLLIDKRFEPLADQIGRYFEENHKAAGGYSLRQDEILIVIKK
jgi:SAM-dependent methyltransferase